MHIMLVQQHRPSLLPPTTASLQRRPTARKQADRHELDASSAASGDFMLTITEVVESETPLPQVLPHPVCCPKHD